VATHGRGVYVIDDVTPLRTLTPETQREPLHLFPAAPGRLHRRMQASGASRAGAGDFRGENRPYGIQLTYSLNAPGLPHPNVEAERERKEKERADARARQAAADPARDPGRPPAGPEAGLKEDPPPITEGTGGRGGAKGPRVEIRIEDASGKLIRKMDGPANLGLNRATWDLGRDLFREPPTTSRGGFRESESGPKVPPGTYRVTVKYGEHQDQGTVQVVADPFTKNTDQDWQAREAALERVRVIQDSVVEAIERIASTRSDIEVVRKKLTAAEKARKDKGEEGEDPYRDLKKAARDLETKLNKAEETLQVPSTAKGIQDESGKAFAQAEEARRYLESSWDRPNATHLATLDRAEATARTALAEVNRVFSEDVAAFRKRVQEAGIGLLGE
jgi:hypothetical protein